MMHPGYDVGRLDEERRRINEQVAVVETALQNYAGTALRYRAFLQRALESAPYRGDSSVDSAKIEDADSAELVLAA